MLKTATCGVINYCAAIWDFRYFWMCLVRAELQRRYRRSVLGVGWSLLQPLAMTTVLSLVYAKLFNTNFLEFGPLLLTGLAFWGYFSSSVLQGCSCLINAEAYLRQQPTPTAIFPLRTVLTLGFHFLISLVVALVFLWCVHGPRNPMALLSLIPTLLLLFVFGWSMCILASYAHVWFPDTQHLSEVGLQALMFLTPVVYPPTLLQQNGLGAVLQYSPLAILLQMVRDPLLNAQAPTATTFALATAFVLLAAGCAAAVLARLERKLIYAL